jgi:hypothetical protein
MTGVLGLGWHFLSIIGGTTVTTVCIIHPAGDYHHRHHHSIALVTYDVAAILPVSKTGSHSKS